MNVLAEFAGPHIIRFLNLLRPLSRSSFMELVKACTFHSVLTPLGHKNATFRSIQKHILPALPPLEFQCVTFEIFGVFLERCSFPKLYLTPRKQCMVLD